jgi:hypothetical protein
MRSIGALVVATFALLAGGVVPEARAAGFADSPCPEAGGGGIRVCPEATVGQPYALALEGRGGCGPALPYQYRLLNGVLPPGLSLSANGEVRGRPTASGTWDFWLQQSDEDPPSASWCRPARSEREFRITVAAPVATVGAPYSFALGEPDAGERTWSLISGILPPGLTLGTSGVIGGTPSVSGGFPVILAARDDTGHEAHVGFTMMVYPRFVIVSSRLRQDVRVGRVFRMRLPVQGAVGGVSYRVVSGRFPSGVRLDTRAGVVAGTPRTAGVFRLTIQALDSLGREATRSITFTVRPVPKHRLRR